MITVYIEGLGIVEAKLLQVYPDGSVRVQHNGVQYIVVPE